MKPHLVPFDSEYMAGCQQPFLYKTAGDNRLSTAIFGPKWLVTTGCQQPLPKKNYHSIILNTLLFGVRKGKFLLAQQNFCSRWLENRFVRLCILLRGHNMLF